MNCKKRGKNRIIRTLTLTAALSGFLGVQANASMEDRFERVGELVTAEEETGSIGSLIPMRMARMPGLPEETETESGKRTVSGRRRETGPESGTEELTETKTEEEPETESEEQTGSETETGSEAKRAAEAESETGTELGTEAETETETEPETGTESVTEAGTGTEEVETETAEPETEPVSETESAEAETETANETESAEPETETVSETESAEPETETASETESAEPESEAVSETEKAEPETEVPETETAGPETETEAPAPETEAPVPETEAPAPETEAPAPETEAPAPETEASVPETEAPVPETEAPAPETEAPVPETEAPAPETKAPAPETEASAPETEAPAPETEASVPETLVPETEAETEGIPEGTLTIPEDLERTVAELTGIEMETEPEAEAETETEEETEPDERTLVAEAMLQEVQLGSDFRIPMQMPEELGGMPAFPSYHCKKLPFEPKETENWEENGSLWDLGASIRNTLMGYEGEWSVYVKNLNTNESFLINDTPMKSASVMKLFIMGTVYTSINAGELERTDDVVYLLNQMITYSDNEASNELLYILGNGSYAAGIARVNKFIRENGYSEMTVEYNGFSNPATNTGNGTNQVSAADVGQLLEDIYRRTWLTRGESNEVESMMLAQDTRYKIPSGLPEGVLCANKTGEMDGTENDAAIIYSDGCDYILVILSSDWWDTDQAVSRIGELSAIVYNFFNS